MGLRPREASSQEPANSVHLLLVGKASPFEHIKDDGVRGYERDQKMSRISGGQDERDGAKGGPSLCLHIVFDGAVPWRDGAISAPSHCAAAIFVPPDCRILREGLSRVMGTPMRGDRINHGA
jgi:hypothetical protein